MIWKNEILLRIYGLTQIKFYLIHIYNYIYALYYWTLHHISIVVCLLSVLLAANHFFAQGKEAQDTLQTQRMEDDRTGPGLGTHSQLT